MAAAPGVAYAVEDPGHPALGRRCARMTVGPEAPPAWRGWHQSVPVQPGKTYLVAAWMKCRDVAGEVRVHLHRYTAQGKHSQREPMTSIGPGLRGTRDGSLQWGLVAMPADTVRLDLHLTMNTRGTVWHDEVVVAEVLPARLAATEGRPLPATGVALWQVPAVVKVFEDDVPPDDAAPLALATARNEQEPLQLAIRGGRSMGQVRVEVEPPSSTWKHVPDWDGFITVWGIGHYGNVSPEQMTRIRQGGARWPKRSWHWDHEGTRRHRKMAHEPAA